MLLPLPNTKYKSFLSILDTNLKINCFPQKRYRRKAIIDIECKTVEASVKWDSYAVGEELLQQDILKTACRRVEDFMRQEIMKTA